MIVELRYFRLLRAEQAEQWKQISGDPDPSVQAKHSSGTALFSVPAYHYYYFPNTL